MRAVLDIHGIEYFQALHFLAQLFPSVKHRGIFLEIPKLSLQEIVEVEHLKKSFFILFIGLMNTSSHLVFLFTFNFSVFFVISNLHALGI